MKNFIALCTIAILGVGANTSRSKADFLVKLQVGGASITFDGTTQTTTATGGATVNGTIDYSVPGEISFLNVVVSTAGTTGGFKISSTIADSNSPGSPSAATLSLSSLKILNQDTVTPAAFSTLTITTGDTGFTSPAGDPTAPVTSTISATANGSNAHNATVSFNSYLDNTDTQFGTQQSVTPISLTVKPGQSQSDNKTSFLNAATSPYSLTQVAQITLWKGESLTDGSSGTTLATPAPAALLLALSGMPVLGLGLRIRRRLAPVAA